MKKTAPMGPFGLLRPFNVEKLSEKKLINMYCYGWLKKVDGQWQLNERGLTLFYYA